MNVQTVELGPFTFQMKHVWFYETVLKMLQPVKRKSGPGIVPATGPFSIRMGLKYIKGILPYLWQWKLHMSYHIISHHITSYSPLCVCLCVSVSACVCWLNVLLPLVWWNYSHLLAYVEVRHTNRSKACIIHSQQNWVILFCIRCQTCHSHHSTMASNDDMSTAPPRVVKFMTRYHILLFIIGTMYFNYDALGSILGRCMVIIHVQI